MGIGHAPVAIDIQYCVPNSYAGTSPHVHQGCKARGRGEEGDDVRADDQMGQTCGNLLIDLARR